MRELEWMQIISFILKVKSKFKENANGKFVHTLIYKPSTNETVNVFSRNVGSVWQNSCKNEVETDDRIRKNSNLNDR